MVFHQEELVPSREKSGPALSADPGHVSESIERGEMVNLIKGGSPRWSRRTTNE